MRLKGDHSPFDDIPSNGGFENGWKADFAKRLAFQVKDFGCSLAHFSKPHFP
jgi:hypothetical protein